MEGDDAVSTATCSFGDTSPVVNPLRYKGPHQRVFKDARLNFKCFQSQHYEDLFMFQHYFANVSKGFFVELGALDGWSYSVTYFFEQFLRWDGLLIEASPKNYQLFRQRMKKLPPRRRRRVPFLLRAVCSDAAKTVTYVSKSGTGAGILEFMPQDEQDRNRRTCRTLAPSASLLPQAGDKKDGGNEPGAFSDLSNIKDCVLTPILCARLTDLLLQNKAESIDMFVLDVEGAEFEVLSSLDLARISVRFFLIELDGKSKRKDAAVRCILREHGFEPVGRLDLNEVWRNTKFDSKDRKYGEPVPLKSWTDCFSNRIDPKRFFNSANQVTVVSNAGAAPQDQFSNDPDMNSFPEMGALSDAGSDFHWELFIVVLVPLGVCLLRMLRARHR